MAPSLESVGRNLKYAVRTLRREPMFVAGVVLTFALAIGTNAAMFGLVTQLMLAPPPGIGDADRVAQIRLSFLDDDGGAFVASTTSYPTFRALRAITGAFSAVAATREDTLTVGRSPSVAQIAVIGATGDYFATLGTSPALGRFFGPGDDELPSGNSVIVLSHAYWQRIFGGDRGVLGREVIVDDQPFTIIGVAPRGFNGDGMAAVDAFMPFSASMRKRGGDWATNQFMNLLAIVVRVRDGLTPVAARQMASAALREQQSSPTGRVRTPGVELWPVVPGSASRQSPQARIALWLAAVSVIVLLIATANVGTLLSLRSARRRREVAVRVAMGASYADLARQLLVEGVLLASIGAAVGLLMSHWVSDIVRVRLLPNLATTESFADRRVLAASILAAGLAGIVAGLAPLTQARNTNLSAQLRTGGGSGASGRLAFQNTLVSVQVALCMLLVVGAALFVRSLQRVQSQDLGFSTSKLLYVTLDFRGYVSGVEKDLAYYDAVQRVRTRAGVGAASVVAGIPFGPHNIPPISVPGAKPLGPNGAVQIPIMYGATPDYLKMMDVSLVGGRLLTERDGRGAAQVVLVNESMARTVWPGQSALGKCVRIGFGTFPMVDGINPADAAPCREVVGVVRDSRARSLRPEHNEDKIMQYYVPFDQLPDSPRPDPSQVMGLIVRTTGDIDRTSALVQRTIHATSAIRVYARVRPYQDLIDPQLRSWRLGATLFSAFSALALGIAAVGLFGVVSYLVTQRTQEIGVRLALGGTSQRVARLIVGDALRLASVGVAIGVAGALAAGPLVASMLFQTSPREPLSIAIAGVVLLTATVVAAAWPAWRAGRVNPVVALRAE